jgi:hypothetical protein
MISCGLKAMPLKEFFIIVLALSINIALFSFVIGCLEVELSLALI